MYTDILSRNARRYEELSSWGDCVTETLVNLDFSSAARDFSGSYQYLASESCVVARLFGTAHKTVRSQRKVREVDNDFVLLLHLKKGPALVEVVPDFETGA